MKTKSENTTSFLVPLFVGIFAFLGIGFSILAARLSFCHILSNPFICSNEGATILEALLTVVGTTLYMLWYLGRIGTATALTRRKATQILVIVALSPFILWLLLFSLFGHW